MSVRIAALTLGVALCLAATPAASQQLTGPTQAEPTAPQIDPNPPSMRRGEGTNLRRRGEVRSAPAAPSAEEVAAATLAQAQTLAQTAVPACQVSEAKLLGANAEGQRYFEVACASGPGYILAETAPPQASDCVLLAGQAELARERDPAADAGTQCSLPANTDVVRVMASYAQEAGLSCTVDQGMAVGRTTEGNAIYEIGCAGTQGYWLEKTATGWVNTECLQVITQNAACRFTTPQEGAASVKAMLAGSDAADCDVTQARFMGENANGRFYEAKCAAGDGVIARLQETAVQQVYPCQEAQRIGGGCTLTQVAAAPTAPAAASEQN